MDKIVRLRQEIERQKEINKKLLDGQLKDGCLYALNQVLSFLKTLEEEPDKSLEEAAYKYSFDSRPCIYGQVDVIDAFIAGAEWQASRMPMPEDTVLFQKGVQEGRRLEREDMLKDAVECDLVCIKDRLAAILPMKDFRWTVGDKVRIVVLKEEEE